jgi:transposase
LTPNRLRVHAETRAGLRPSFVIAQVWEKLDREIEQLALPLGDIEENDAERQVRAPALNHLPLETIVHETPRTCPACGETRFGRIGADERAVLDYVPSHFKRVRNIPPKINCRACETFVLGPAPTPPIKKGRLGPALLANALVSKECDHLPLHRQPDIYAHGEVEIDRSVMVDVNRRGVSTPIRIRSH